MPGCYQQRLECMRVAELIQSFFSVMTCRQKQVLCVTDTPFREQLFGGKCSK